MLEIRPNCECCDIDIPAATGAAFICTFECTFCPACAATLGHNCPNCGGELVARPLRPAGKLLTSPPSTKRVRHPTGCRELVASECAWTPAS